ncbi:MAG: TldD/PmbA family protein [Candidatus Cloacimonetes bacterium]|nr:TldD/PmbA family protein [Candidatus Cloacimonadota bacterium]
MYNFPKGFYTDVRIEDVFETNISFLKTELRTCRERNYISAFIRLFDGKRWYYSSTTDVDNIQTEIDKLAALGNPDSQVDEHPYVSRIKVNVGDQRKFAENEVKNVKIENKIELLKRLFPLVENVEEIKIWNCFYQDNLKIKRIINSKGTDVTFDLQIAGMALGFEMVAGEKRFSESYKSTGNSYGEVSPDENEIKELLNKSLNFLYNSEKVNPGKYTLILSPMVAGVFAHESFGHKSEADFMIGDETMKREWAIGKKVGTDILSIVDDGNEIGSGYVPFDDEGNPAKKTYLIQNGVLSGRLHSVATAVALDEEPTGNARAINFEYEPIVRMTTTYIDKGEKTKEQLFAETENGYYIETLKHGSGMSTFTIAPSLAWKIENGKITKPAQISVITGDVFKTLHEIDGLSDKVELLSFVGGGCGKNEQHPLPVGFGGPYVRVRNMDVQ